MTIVFSVENQHVEACGVAPAWTAAVRETSEVRAYFENSYGEQWIASATVDRFLLTWPLTRQTRKSVPSRAPH